MKKMMLLLFPIILVQSLSFSQALNVGFINEVSENGEDTVSIGEIVDPNNLHNPSVIFPKLIATRNLCRNGITPYYFKISRNNGSLIYIYASNIKTISNEEGYTCNKDFNLYKILKRCEVEEDCSYLNELKLISRIYSLRKQIYYTAGIGTCYRKVLVIKKRKTNFKHPVSPEVIQKEISIGKVNTKCPSDGALIVPE